MNTAFADTETPPLILELLSRRNWFKPKQLGEIEELLQKSTANTLPEVALIQAGHITEQDIANIYAEDLFLPSIGKGWEAGAIDADVGSLLPQKLCTDRLICPLAVRDEVLDVAFVSPEEMGVVDELQLLTGLRINPIIAPLSVVQARLDALYRSDQNAKSIGEGTEEFDVTEGEDRREDENILNLDVSTPSDANGRIIRMVNQILEQVLRIITPATSTSSHSRMAASSSLRIDGVLHESCPLPSKAIFIMIISRLKVLAKMEA